MSQKLLTIVTEKQTAEMKLRSAPSMTQLIEAETTADLSTRVRRYDVSSHRPNVKPNRDKAG
jgi:hypothetical protein